mgnify:CR=1 FL=1
MAQLVELVVSDVCAPMQRLTSAMFAGLAAMAEIPAPGNVTLEVEANLKQRSGFPASAHARAMSSRWSCSSAASNRWCIP